MHRSFSTVIPAAGNSERMGADKASLTTGHGMTFAAHLVNCYGAYGCKPVILVVNAQFDVSGFHSENILAVVNHQVEQGRSWSIHLGLQHVPPGYGCFIQNVDNPYLEPYILDKLLESVTPGGYAVPVYKGRGGHPILLGGKMADTLREMNELFDFRQTLQRFPRIEVPCTEEAVLLNLNTPADYTEFIRRNRF